MSILGDHMPSVTILRPGQKGIDEASGQFRWTFNAEVDGRVGVISVFSPAPIPESSAAENAKLFLEVDPSNLGGVVSTEMP
ncbi:hypothetical protein [Streptomyces sp. ME18-1-4]|jgi:hypothetical protein|uniref:hypothetical protein n=2 Tax=Streptomyces TaxID=1883 RepID=UPI0029CA41E6|nr:hypothetical protein [Streptomyces sp. ME18-1-4]